MPDEAGRHAQRLSSAARAPPPDTSPTRSGGSVGPGRTTPGPGAPTGHFVPNYTPEDAIWANVRDRDWAYGFASFSVDPGNRLGGQTSIDVTCYRVKGFGGELEVSDTFTLTRPRNDGRR